MFHKSTDIGEALVSGWGCETKKNLSEHISGLDDEREIKCLLSYIAQLLEPISKIARLRCEEINKEKRKKRDSQIKKRKATTKPWRDKLAKLRAKDNFYYYKVLNGISSCLWHYEYYDWEWSLKMAKQLLSKPVKEWQQKEVLTLRMVGKVTAKGFAEYQKTLK